MGDSGKRRLRSNLSLRSIRRIGTSRDKNGLPTNSISKIIKHRTLVQQAASYRERRETRLQGKSFIFKGGTIEPKVLTFFTAMTVDERRALEALRDDPALHPSFNEGTEDFDFDDVWNGTEPLPISHAGGEFNDLARDILGDTWKM